MTKQLFYSVFDDMNREKTKENVLIALKSIATLIPALGGTLTTVWSDIEAIQAKRKHERLENFYVELKNDLENVKEQLDVAFISKPDFLDIFELTARYIVNERTEEKRILFRNIFLNSMIKKDCNYDKTEKFLRTLEQMNSLELLILRVLWDPERFNELQGEIIRDPNQARPGVRNMIHYSMVYEFSEVLCELIRAEKEDVLEAMYFLEINRLVTEKSANYRVKTNGHPIHTLDGSLTLRGKDFISFIIR